ncbi:MAG: lipopolysaccharide biosynthesis [Oscillatoriophycideae cyanobacterium NC_groundwater_1537_Pr4_S-0.65um_50_18]|nr:lipopolysaccharide biosynthesis [Oscillatoriophycideae cyanobacterium NC_groundwater_1537_Pr4_S-0.65um_50_18]
MAPPLLTRYLLALDRHKWFALAGFIAVTGLSGGVAILQPPPSSIYLAEGLLIYGAPPEIFSTTGAKLQQQGQAVTPEMLLSRPVLEYTLQKLEEQDIKVSVKRIQESTKVVIAGQGDDKAAPEAKEQTQGLQVSVTYRDSRGERATAIATALMDAMVEQSRQFNQQQLNRINANLNQLLPKVTQELRQAEQNLEGYVRQEGTALQAAESGSLLSNITANQQQQRQLRLSLSGIEAQLVSLQSRLGMTPDQAYASSALSADPIIGDLRAKIYQTEAQRDLLAKTLRPDHPLMVDLQNQLSTYAQLLQSRVSEVLGAPLQDSQIRQSINLDPARQQLASTLVGLQTQREISQQQLAALSQTEQELRQEYSGIPNKQLGQQRLQQQVILKQTFYDQIQARLADVKLAQEETVGSLVIAQPPQVEALPVKAASSLAILLIGSLMGLVVGGGLVLLLDSIDPVIYTLEDLQNALKAEDVPILGLLPTLPWDGETASLAIATDALPTAYTETYERLRGNLQRLGGSKGLRVVLVTSTLNEEGKTVVAYNLAIASARAGKRTLLIETNLRSPSPAIALKVTLDSHSQLEPLRYYGNLSDCIQMVPAIENLYIVPSVGPQRQAAALLESSEMHRLLEDARNRFDLVILDAPALDRYNDALLLEPYTDGLLLVTRPGYTESGPLNEATQQFVESEDIQFLGAVVNDANMPLQFSEAIEVARSTVLQ